MLYLAGNKEESISHIGLYLQMQSATSHPFKVDLRLGILDKEGKNSIVFDKSNETREELMESMFGSEEFIHHDDLFTSKEEYIRNKTLTLVCEVNLLYFK